MRSGLLVVVMLVASLSAALAQPTRHPQAPAAAAGPGAWPTYHMDNTRSGNDPNEPVFNAVTNQWSSVQLDGAIYAEPLVVGSTVYVATEGDSIYALDASTGAVNWRTNIGTPVPGSSLPCGNISTVGITSTPVIDPANNVLYALGLVTGPQHLLVALNLGTGATLWSRNVDVPGLDPAIQGERGALALSQGYVYAPFGGRYGDCGSYHGWVVGAPTNGTGALIQKSVTGPGGGIWAASGPAVDAATGNVFVATGNTFSTTTYDYGESVVKLSPSLAQLDYFAPSNWAALNGGDTDLGSVGPAILANGWVFQVGKSGDGFLINQGNMGHVGAAFGGTAYAAPFIYVPCTNGLVALNVNTGATPSFTVAWQGPTGESPIVAGGLVWTIDRSGILYGLDPATGATRYNFALGSATAHFATPSAGGGRIFVGADTRVLAFGNPIVTPGGSYHPLTPARILDTRSSSPIGSGQSIDVQVAGAGGVPATGAAAAVLNVTVTQPTASGYLTVYPAGAGRPVASNLNFVAGQTVPNLVEVALGTSGKVTAFNFSGSTQVVFDVAGWVATPPPGTDGRFNPLPPARILDTRNGTGGFTGPLGTSSSIDVQVTGQGTVPATGVAAVVLNVTATSPTTGGYLTVFPTGATRPLASNLNFLAGQTVPNRVIVKVGTGGKVSFYNFNGNTDVVADVGGWFTDATSTAGGTVFSGITPARLLDTRAGSPVASGATLTQQVAGALVPATAKAVVMNVTVTNTTAPSYLTVWPDATTRPVASDLNWVAGQTVPNLVIVQLSANGVVDVYNFQGTTDVVMDVVGWYS
jgi:outer membrane protein assembly factor BamB